MEEMTFYVVEQPNKVVLHVHNGPQINSVIELDPSKSYLFSVPEKTTVEGLQRLREMLREYGIHNTLFIIGNDVSVELVQQWLDSRNEEPILN